MLSFSFMFRGYTLATIFNLAVRQGATILIWGYAKGKMLILGYTSTKRLRDPVLSIAHAKVHSMGPTKMLIRFPPFTFVKKLMQAKK
jgi:hypothetical protein